MSHVGSVQGLGWPCQLFKDHILNYGQGMMEGIMLPPE